MAGVLKAYQENRLVRCSGRAQQCSQVGTSRAACIGKLDNSRPLRTVDQTEQSLNIQKENQNDDPVCGLVAQGRVQLKNHDGTSRWRSG